MFEGIFRPTHLILILVVALIMFGPRKLPELGAALGKTLRDFKRAVNEPLQESNDEATSKEIERGKR
jgi:sec-independent protein translocase protein TatA